MDSITLRDFRCFHDEQTARLAPLTLLVGENSTGKTSFMAMIRVLRDVASGYRAPNFKREPYDLGSFDEIAHHRGGRAGRAATFAAAFTTSTPPRPRGQPQRARPLPYRFEVTFEKRGTAPVPSRIVRSNGTLTIEEDFSKNTVLLRNARGSWHIQLPAQMNRWPSDDSDSDFPTFYPQLLDPLFWAEDFDDITFNPLSNSPPFDPKSELRSFREFAFSPPLLLEEQAFASSPVRSKPHRTYDPSQLTPDPEGDYVPMYLANLFFQSKSKWGDIKSKLEHFGKDAGLFDEITIRPLGKGSDPFQIQVRKFGQRGPKGPRRNLIDVGYGISQVLPLATELLKPGPPPLFLVQQPEVHLHPSAQAALGSLFCQVASRTNQLIVETHSDHLMDRIRMDVRDGRTKLRAKDISILFFERHGLHVNVHSLVLDEEGNISGSPLGYRRFFVEESERSLGF